MSPRNITHTRCNVRSLSGLSVHTTRRPSAAATWWQALAVCLLSAASGIAACVILYRIHP